MDSWVALWFSGGVVLLVMSRVALQHHKIWSRAGRLDEVVAIVGAGAASQRLLRSLTRGPGRPALSASTTTMRITCRSGAWAMPFSVRSTRWCATRAHMESTPSRGAALNERASAGRDVNKLSLLPVDVRLCPGEFGHASRPPSGEPHRRSHLPERHRPPVERPAVDRQTDRGPAAERIDPYADLAAHGSDRRA